ncbi:MAG TPA: TPM domain-containing protein [Chryseosolibacter sp.]|nr:TPM domain-containing protein [Chryseosolibacter sp.]
MKILLATLPMVALGLKAQTYVVETVPNTKLATGSYVSNPDNIIRVSSVATIDSILKNVETKTGAQVAVVVLSSIGEADVFSFAQDLFGHWKIGRAGVDDGLLILFVEDQRTVHFHTGYGVEGVLPDITCKQIQTEFMVPHFREGGYDEGMVQGVREVSRILVTAEPAEFAGAATTQEEIPLYGYTTWLILFWIIVVVIAYFVKKKNKSFLDDTVAGDVPKVRPRAGTWLLWYVVVAVVLMIALSVTDEAAAFAGGMYAYLGASFLIRRRHLDQESGRWLLRKEYSTLYNFYQQEQGLFSALRFIFPIPFAFLYSGYKRKMQFLRDHPRDCKQCGKPLLKLDEKSDDAFLTKAQLMEEALHSVDYDVWKCGACNAADKLTYTNRGSKYEPCPKCQARTYYRVSNSVVRPATTVSEGAGEEIHACKFCGHRNVRRYTIARIQKSSSSSSSGSSGGSWGGGSSGGGGASSRW